MAGYITDDKETSLIISLDKADLDASESSSSSGGSYIKSTISSSISSLSISTEGSSFDLDTSVGAKYLIAHRCNSLNSISQALSYGANALECDIRYSTKRHAWFVEHEAIFPWSPKLTDWLEECKRCAHKFAEKFALIIFDIKTPKHIHSLPKSVRSILPPDLYVIYSTAHFKHAENFDNALPHLTPYDGVAIDYHNDPDQLNEYFRLRNFENVWYGNGIFSLFALKLIAPNVRPSIKRAMELRNNLPSSSSDSLSLANSSASSISSDITSSFSKVNPSCIKKVYVWTVQSANSKTFRYYLIRYKVDGIMVEIGALKASVKAIAKNGLRLATRNDVAF